MSPGDGTRCANSEITSGEGSVIYICPPSQPPALKLDDSSCSAFFSHISPPPIVITEAYDGITYSDGDSPTNKMSTNSVPSCDTNDKNQAAIHLQANPPPAIDQAISTDLADNRATAAEAEQEMRDDSLSMYSQESLDGIPWPEQDRSLSVYSQESYSSVVGNEPHIHSSPISPARSSFSRLKWQRRSSDLCLWASLNHDEELEPSLLSIVTQATSGYPSRSNIHHLRDKRIQNIITQCTTTQEGLPGLRPLLLPQRVLERQGLGAEMRQGLGSRAVHDVLALLDTIRLLDWLEEDEATS